MNTTAGILAGLLVAGAAVTVFRFARRQAEGLRAAFDEIRSTSTKSTNMVIEFEKDPATGVYRKRS